MRKIVLTLSVIMFASSVAFAADSKPGDIGLAVTWNWEMEDPNVVAYRYQLDGENDNSWTQVGAQVRSFTVRNIDPSKDHSLYLQQSYDRIRWSASAVSEISSETLVQAQQDIADAKNSTQTVTEESEDSVVVEE